jgi:MmyB-like transcription regulator ligand binding domain
MKVARYVFAHGRNRGTARREKRYYDVLSANDALALLTDGVAQELLEAPANALRLTLHPRGMAPRILNFEEWSAHLLHRLRRQVSITGDPELQRLHDELSIEAFYPANAATATRLLEDVIGAE